MANAVRKMRRANPKPPLSQQKECRASAPSQGLSFKYPTPPQRRFCGPSFRSRGPIETRTGARNSLQWPCKEGRTDDIIGPHFIPTPGWHHRPPKPPQPPPLDSTTRPQSTLGESPRIRKPSPAPRLYPYFSLPKSPPKALTTPKPLTRVTPLTSPRGRPPSP